MLPGESLADYNQRMTAEATAAWHAKNPSFGAVMPHVSQMITSKYIGTADLAAGPRVVTIRACTLENMARGGSTPDQKWVMWFAEVPKGLRLNNTTLRYLEQYLGPNSEAWSGQRVKLYVDPTVQFGGQMVGGVRLKVSAAALAGATHALHGAPGQPVPGAPPPRFDPYTGKPLTTAQGPAEPTPRYDPQTGELLDRPTTGTSPAGTAAVDPEFDDDIPF